MYKLCKVLGSTFSTAKGSFETGVGLYAYNPRIWGVEAETSGVLGHPQLEFEATQDYMRISSWSKKIEKKGDWERQTDEQG